MSINIGYNDVSNEIVDNNSNEEAELIKAINAAIESSNGLTRLECDKLGEQNLEELNEEQLAIFLLKNYFEGGPKTYSQCCNTGKFLNFSMKAALQLLSKNDNSKYNNSGNIDNEHGMTIENRIKNNGGIDLDDDKILVKILQKKVGAYPDGKAGPQTISLVISALGGDISKIYEGVNNLYASNEKFRIQNITEFTIGGKNYKYDKNQFTIGTENDKVKITCNGEIKEVDTSKNPPQCEGFIFGNDWIKKSGTNYPQGQNSNDGSSESSDVEDFTENFENISDDIKVNNNGELVDEDNKSLNEVKTNFIGGLIDRECRKKHGKEGKRSGYNISHEDCLSKMKKGKLSYDSRNEQFNYVNGIICNFKISKINDYYKITDDSKKNGDLGSFEFENLSDAINTIKLIEYIKIRFEGVETGANTGNKYYDKGTSNSSPFFIGEKALYFSSDHGSIGGIIGIYDDENIISTDNLKKVSGAFKKNNSRIDLAKYLISCIDFDEEH